ncbi:hypothetical protein JCM11641_005505 [Rhodosporidiobolus odoratus]
MDSYLDPALDSTLAFLHPAHSADPTLVSNQEPFESYDLWFGHAPAPTYDAQSMLSVSQDGSAAGPPLDARSGQGTVAASHPFEVLGSGMASRGNADSISPLEGSVGTTIGTSGNIHMPYGGADFSPEFLGSTSVASGTATRHLPAIQHSYAPAGSSVAPHPNAMSGTDPSTFSIAAYGDNASPSSSKRSAVHQALSAYSPARNTRRSVKPLRSSSNVATVARSGTKTPKTPQADESVPEAALHLLRLAGTADGSAGSVATNSTGRDDDRSDEDAEGESDDTSIHSIDVLKPLGQLFADPNGSGLHHGQLETRVWLHNPDQPPLHVQRGGGPGSRRPSVTSSATSTRVRQHIPARAQRETSIASSRSRAPSEAPSFASLHHATGSSSQQSPAGSRRQSARVRKTVLPTQPTVADSDDGESEGEYKEDDGDAEEDSDSGRKGKKRSGKSSAKKGKGKRASSAGTSQPAKKARTSSASSAPAASPSASLLPPRKARRQGFIPVNLQNRTFPAHVEVSAEFPRFYRNFPISTAFPPESYVLQAPNVARAAARRAQQQQQLQAQQIAAQQYAQGHSGYNVLPTPPTPMYDAYFGQAFHQQQVSTPLASMGSQQGIPQQGFTVDANGNLHIHDFHLPAPPSHQHPVTHSHSHAILPTQNPLAHPLPVPQHQQSYQHPQTQHSMSPPALPSAAASTSTSVATSPVVSGASTPSATTLPSIPGPDGIPILQPPPEAKWNKPGDPLSLYWPRFVKGNADDKCGMCPICAEPKERGGEGEAKWLKLKNSSYVYHMSYAHGLSNLTGLPFSPPIQLRIVPTNNKTKDTRAEMTEGMCHKCNGWIPLLSIKNVEANVPELIWWKHAKKCHGETTMEGEADPYVVDNVYDLVQRRRVEHQHNAAAAQAAAQALR